MNTYPPYPPGQQPQNGQNPVQPAGAQPVPPAQPNGQWQTPPYGYTQNTPPYAPPARQPQAPPAYTPRPYQQPAPVVLRPMVTQQAAPPMAMKWVKKKSKAPFFLVGLWWLLYALFLPLYRWQDFALCAAASLILFIVSRLLIADKTVAVRMTPKVLAELEAQKRLEQEEARRREQEALAAQEKSSVIPKEAREYLQQMRQADVAIQDEAVSAKIRILEARTNQIFQVVSENPDKLPAIRKFMQYYLPTLLKLLRSYDHMEEQGIRGENIRRTMQEIETVLDTVVEAFNKQLDNLFQEEALDISSDIQVLENMMSQEGLLQRDVFSAPVDTGAPLRQIPGGPEQTE